LSVAAGRASYSRLRVRVRGTVQGVGFRPHVFRLASELQLGGYVLNDAHGVLLEIEGDDRALGDFLVRLVSEAPPLAIVEQVAHEPVERCGERGFRIASSPRGETPDAPVSADTVTCDDCLHELFDPRDRRFRYPFVNCTNCGPRFTIIRGVPYDRPLTTMAGFQMCERCRREYEDPADRRFHAQPNACPDCGPAVSLLGPGGGAVAGAPGADPLREAAAALAEGLILAVKGIGGYHLACRADDESVVARLRARKHREEKPFALMAPDLLGAEQLGELDCAARELLSSRQRPIVLVPRRPGAPVAASVAPRSSELGLMLPYSPLHYLLLADVGTTVVLTSGNLAGEPIAFGDAQAMQQLGDLADLFLIHDRPIHTRTDDSVARIVTVAGQRRPAFLRRSRGYVPGALTLPDACAAPPLLGCGAELKSTFCVAKQRHAWVSHHIGDLQNFETLQSFAQGVEHFERLFAVTPELVAHDLHPEYLSTKYALRREGVELIAVQHHHAHLAAVLAEHGEVGRAVGVIFDGTGLGEDGTIWGGELLVGDIGSSARAGSLHPVTLPGGDRAVRQPWRMACAWLQEATGEEPAIPAPLLSYVEPERWRTIAQLARTGVSAPVSTSAGRLFDAVAAICGVCAEISYEGQAAIELEALCDPHERGSYPVALRRELGFQILDPRPAVAAVARDVRVGESPARIAARFHAGLAEGTVAACAELAAEHGTEIVVLGGGVFANLRLLESVSAGLAGRGLRVLAPAALPPGDGAISYGQVAAAAWRAEV